MIDDKILRAHLKLHLADGVGAIKFRALIEAFGDAVSAASAGPSRLRGVEGIGPKTADAIASVTDQQIDEEIAEAQKRSADIICVAEDRYPPPLRNIYDHPAVIYVRGAILPPDSVAMGVVGSRRCTHYGLEQAMRFGELLGRAGLTVISGGARGIDTAAHRGALAAGGRTIAVMGCGLAHHYPPENADLFEQIASSGRGALVTELPMRTAVLAGNFPTRNRIISGLSLGVLIVEAARGSGALITAKEAAEQGREVFAIPGRVDSPLSNGANELIRNGATLVQNLDDILEHLGGVGSKLGELEQQEAAALPAGLNEIETLLVETLADGPLGLDELCRHSGLESGPAAASLTMLVIKGLVAQQPGNVFARKNRTIGQGLFG